VYSLASRIRSGATTRTLAAFAAAWLAVVVSAVSAATMVWLSGGAPFGVVVGSMTFWHAIIGAGEGAITAGLVGYLAATRPDLLKRSADRARVWTAAAGLGVLAIIAAGASFLASSHPDGLEYVAENLGFLREAEPVFAGSPFPDYVVPGLANETLAGIMAGVVGLVLTGLIVYAAVGAIRRGGRA
jgi:cobalt/nickel transport system permease protein